MNFSKSWLKIETTTVFPNAKGDSMLIIPQKIFSWLKPSLTIILLSVNLTVYAVPISQNPFLSPATNSTDFTTPLQLPVCSNTIKEDCITASITLNYTSAKNLSLALKDLFTGKISVEAITNSILFYGSQQELIKLKELIEKLDVPTRQITLEAKIIAISRENNENLGINWNWDTIPQKDISENSKNKGSEKFAGNFKFWHGYSFKFNAALNALIANGKAKILATPRIITIPGNEASIFIGEHIPVQTEKHDNSGTYTATDYVDAGIKLQYLPIISQDGKMVTANVHTEVSTPTLISELKNYRISSRTADTNVRMYSEETLIIGGLISEEEQESMQRIPLLSKIPILGELFKNRTKKHTKTEVIILLTPHITKAGLSPAIYKKSTNLQ